MFQGPLDNHRVLVCGDDHDRNARVALAQVDQAGKPADTGHMKVQQNQVDFPILIHQCLEALERVGLQEIGFPLVGFQRFLDGGTKQGVIICDDHGFGLYGD